MVEIKAPKTLDYEKEGLVCGLEFHQQVYAPLDESEKSKRHGNKLFCTCPAMIREDDPHFVMNRKLRPVSGETGDIDIASQFEKLKSAEINYEGYHDTNCLIELDEEPPMPVNSEALFRTLSMAKKLFGLELVDQILVSRKNIIDGSNTSGFQRTAQIAYEAKDSHIMVDGKRISIYQANLEEDSAKNTGRSGKVRNFRLDRLGIPLIEIATGPDIRSPEEALATAKRIGELLRTTGFVKRGQGTIRQDLNVSIKRGTRIEIKGVSELDLLETYVRNEAIRQNRMLDLLETMKEKGLVVDDLDMIKAVDLTKVYKKTEAKFVKKALKNKQKVTGAILPKLAGLLKYELQEDYRLGSELSEICKVTAGVGGILHSDELPKFGISEEEVAETRKVLKVGEEDGFFLVIASKDQGHKSVAGVQMAIRTWLEHDGLIPEVRAPRADGTTGYLRPLPGKARMYPETDVPPMILTDELLEKIDKLVFEMPEDRVKRYTKDYNLSGELADMLAIHPDNTLFEELTEAHKVDPTLVANTLLSTIVDLRRQGLDDTKITQQDLHDTFEQVAQDAISKDSVITLLEAICKAKKPLPVEKHIDKLNLKKMDTELVREKVIEAIEENKEFLERGMGAMKPLMGKAMAKLRGKADGQLVSTLLKEEIEKHI